MKLRELVGILPRYNIKTIYVTNTNIQVDMEKLQRKELDDYYYNLEVEEIKPCVEAVNRKIDNCINVYAMCNVYCYQVYEEE